MNVDDLKSFIDESIRVAKAHDYYPQSLWARVLGTERYPQSKKLVLSGDIRSGFTSKLRCPLWCAFRTHLGHRATSEKGQKATSQPFSRAGVRERCTVTCYCDRAFTGSLTFSLFAISTLRT